MGTTNEGKLGERATGDQGLVPAAPPERRRPVMSYITEVHRRIAAAFADEFPTHIGINPMAEEFEIRREHIEKVASLFDEYMHALAIDAAEGSDRIKPKEWIGAVSTALSDQSLTYQYTEAAEALREDEPRERSDFEEHNTLSRAYQGV